MSYGVILLFLLPLFFCLGLTCLILSFRGRSIAGTRICRRCHFDLASNSPAVCPECGSNLQLPNAIGPRRARSKLKIGAALLLTALPLSLLVAFLVVAFSTSRFNQFKPAWALSIEASGALGPASSGAIDELTRRTKVGELSKSQIDALVTRAMKLRTTPQAQWNSAWSDYLEQARSSGHLANAQWLDYIRHTTVITHRTRSRIRTGSTSIASISFAAPQLGSKTSPQPNIILSAKLKERRIGESEAKGSEHVGMFGINKNGSASTTHDFQCDAPPGVSEIRTCLTITLIDIFQANEEVGTWQQDFVNPVEIVAPEADILQVNNDPSLAAKVRSSLQTPIVRRSSTSDLYVTVQINGTPHDLGFDIILRPRGTTSKDTELRIGQIAFLKGATNSSYQAGRNSPEFTDDAVDVILRPSVSAAENNPDLSTVWLGPDLIFENVQIEPEK